MCETSSSNLLGKITVVIAICCCCLSAQAKYGGGSGTQNDPYQIRDANHMQAIGADPCDWDKCFKLMADIDLSSYTGTSFNIIGIDDGNPFTGTFDGNGHTISNFTYITTGTYYIALFGFVRLGEIKNLGLINAEVHAGTGDRVGSIVGTLRDGTVSTCYSKGGSVWGRNSIGGLAGENRGTITNCYSDGSVSGNDEVGGLVGIVGGGTIMNSYATGSVTGGMFVGGLVGKNGWTSFYTYYGFISNCYSASSVSGDRRVGGLVGYNFRGGIYNCYATGSVSGTTYVGGMVGFHDSTITRCYSTGSVSGITYVGGLVGYNSSAKVSDSFWDIETSGQTNSDGGTPKTTAEMQTVSTFFAWVCTPVWILDEGNDYPRLAWQNTPGPTIAGGFLGGGRGTQADPYLIYTAEQLNTIGLFPCLWDKQFKLTADIDLGGFAGSTFNIIGYSVNYDYKPFRGVFDGNGHTISNFTSKMGIFRLVDGGKITNLGLIDPNVDAGAGDNVGSLVGTLREGIMTNCYATGFVSGDDNVGGLVGYNGEGIVTNCSSTASVSGHLYVGGLVGYNEEGTITNCDSEADVNGGSYVGGLVGNNDWGSTINNCYSTGDVTGDEYIGGLVGENGGIISNCNSSAGVSGIEEVGGLVGGNWYEGSIFNCFASGNVNGDGHVGGLVGKNYGIISNCYSTGDVDGDFRVGGLVGGNWYEGSIFNCYSNGSVMGDSAVGGLVGWSSLESVVIGSFWDIETSGQTTSQGGIGLPTARMKMADTFVNWGACGEVWTIDDGKDYPRLLWENMPGELITFPSDLYGAGTGEPNNPYLIYTAEQLNTIGLIPCHWDKHFKLRADIDMSGFTGESFNIIGSSPIKFTGVFDGNNHTISNFICDSNDRNNIGLFGFVDGDNAEIKNLGLVNPNVYAGTGDSIGSLVGCLEQGTITDCYVEGGSVSGTGLYVGGLVGTNSAGMMTACYVTGNVMGDTSVGGLVGSSRGTITDCYSTDSVSGTTNVGGLVGYNRSTITNCCAKGSVTGNSEVGGLVGYNRGKVVNCYSTGSVTADDNTGGLVGYHYTGTVTTSYSAGSVVGVSGVGGLVGHNYRGTVSASFWDIETSGQTTSAGGWGKTTARMQTASTFYAWPCEDVFVWTIDEGNDYPRLVWENKLGELITIPPGLYGAGSGEPDDPYLIYTAEQLNTIGLVPCHLDKHFLLCADIDLCGCGFKGTSFNIIGYYVSSSDNKPFSGVFDGNSHTISNFIYDSNDRDNIGLFGFVDGDNAEIKNLGLVNPSVYAGTGDSIGSLVGCLEEGAITDCYVEGGSVVGYSNVGGLCGFNNGTIIHCATSNVKGKGENIGGLTGSDGVSSSCVTVSVTGYSYVGGLVGYSGERSTISNCYSSSKVFGNDKVGGLAGSNEYRHSIITKCYSDGSVSGNTDIGGLVGTNLALTAGAVTFESIPFNIRYVGGTCLSLDDDEVSSAIPIPFAFNFYGTDFSQLYVSSNGFVTFLPEQSDGCCSGQALPDPDSPNGLIAGFWADLDPLEGGDICYQSLGTAGSREFVVGFYDVPHIGGDPPVTFEIILHEGTNDIELQYDSAPSDGEIHSVGIENLDGTDGFQIAFGDVSFINEGFSTMASDGGISDSYSTTMVTGNVDVGGLVGWNEGTISNCYATGHVNGTNYIGGLVGYDSDGMYTRSFWNTTVNAALTGIGNTSDPNVIGASTKNLKTESTYVDSGWDFVGETVNGTEDIWTIHEEVDYPKLVWELVQFVGWDGVDFRDYSFFANRWQDTNCGCANDCDGADLDFSDKVDGADLKIFFDHWLEGVQ